MATGHFGYTDAAKLEDSGHYGTITKNRNYKVSYEYEEKKPFATS